MLGALVIAVLAILIAIAMWLCGRGKIPVNSVFGIRIRTFTASEEAWRVGHRAAVGPMIGAAIGCLIVTGLSALDTGLDGANVALLINTGLIAAGVVIGAIVGSYAIGRAGVR